jgi:hypothetical protein
VPEVVVPEATVVPVPPVPLVVPEVVVPEATVVPVPPVVPEVVVPEATVPPVPPVVPEVVVPEATVVPVPPVVPEVVVPEATVVPVPPVPLVVPEPPSPTLAAEPPLGTLLSKEFGSMRFDFGGHVRAVGLVSGVPQQGKSSNTTLSELRLAHVHMQATLADGSAGFRLQQDFAGRGLEEAYFLFPVAEGHVQMGRFRAPLTASNMRDEGNLFFLERSRIGSLFGEGRGGLLATGSLQHLDWALALQDGGDAIGQELLTTARLTYQFLGQSDAGEGQISETPGTSGTFSASGFEDTSTAGAKGLALDLQLEGRVYSLGVEVLFLGDHVYTGNGNATEWLGTSRMSLLSPRSIPWAVQGSFLILPRWEAGLRFQDSDNDAREFRVDMALSRRNQSGPMLWTGQYSQLKSDLRGDAGILQLGLGLGF